MPTPQIIAMGGGGFSMETGPSPLDQYILKQTGRRTPKVIFLPTASGDADSYIVRFYSAFHKLDCAPSHLKFFDRTPDLRRAILEQDVVYVGGGNTKSMLAVWREWGLPEILREAWRNGVVMCGLSAGAICWFEQGLTDSWDEVLRPLDCLGFLPGSCCPHYDSEAERGPVYCDLVGRGAMPPGYALSDLAAVHFHGTELHRVIASHAAVNAYRIDRLGDAGVPTVLFPEVVG